MFPPTAIRTAVPPPPPEIQAQQMQQGQPAAPMFAQMGSAMPNPVDILKGKLAQLEEWMRDTVNVTNQVNPALTTLLVPMAQAGKAMLSEISQLEQRMAGPSPQVMGSAPPNVPGNIPGGRPAM